MPIVSGRPEPDFVLIRLANDQRTRVAQSSDGIGIHRCDATDRAQKARPGACAVAQHVDSVFDSDRDSIQHTLWHAVPISFQRSIGLLHHIVSMHGSHCHQRVIRITIGIFDRGDHGSGDVNRTHFPRCVPGGVIPNRPMAKPHGRILQRHVVVDARKFFHAKVRREIVFALFDLGGKFRQGIIQRHFLQDSRESIDISDHRSHT
mmetsp:Transcript_19402/g.39927  ORF Transcript_19402/g.39927 Transcript_19402/m.39927 type:complete len:205 (+) Transcript_19402:2663-3277(+)